MGTESDLVVSCIVATYNRKGDVKELVRSILKQDYDSVEIVIVSSSTDGTRELFEDGGEFDDSSIKYHHCDGRVGVPKARNIGFSLASGDVYVSVDDDAVILDTDALSRVVDVFEKHDDVGAVAFRSVDYETGVTNRDEIPDPPEFDLNPEQWFRAPHFVGVGHAIKEEVIAVTGEYPDHFVYGFEEIDLSLRIHDNDYDILYTPQVRVAHKKSPGGRLDKEEIQRRLVENRIRLAMRNLPWRYVFFTAIVWSLYSTVLTRSLKVPLEIHSNISDDSEDLLKSRQKLDANTIRRLKQRNALLFGWWLGPHPKRFIGPNGTLERFKWES